MYNSHFTRARVTKLVDVADLKSAAARRTGSIPVPGTRAVKRDEVRKALILQGFLNLQV